MNKPLVSIIIPTKNSARTIEACLQSCKQQTYSSIEIIVVDNFSTDWTDQIALHYADKVFQKWSERTAQKNYGIQQAQGEYLLIIDGDMSIDQELIEDCIHNITNHPMWWWVVIPVIDTWSSYWTQVIAFERSFYQWTNMEAARFLKKSLVEQVWWFQNIIFYEEFIVPQLIEQAWYNVKIYTNYNIYHDYDDFTFWWNLKKKFYYGKSLNEYKKQMNKLWIINVAAQQTNIFHRYYTFLKDKRFYQKPLLALWVLVLKTMEFGVGWWWLLYKKIKQVSKISLFSILLSIITLLHTHDWISNQNKEIMLLQNSVNEQSNINNHTKNKDSQEFIDGLYERFNEPKIRNMLECFKKSWDCAKDYTNIDVNRLLDIVEDVFIKQEKFNITDDEMQSNFARVRDVICEDRSWKYFKDFIIKNGWYQRTLNSCK